MWTRAPEFDKRPAMTTLATRGAIRLLENCAGAWLDTYEPTRVFHSHALTAFFPS
jgi:hypothetical protein